MALGGLSLICFQLMAAKRASPRGRAMKGIKYTVPRIPVGTGASIIDASGKSVTEGSTGIGLNVGGIFTTGLQNNVGKLGEAILSAVNPAIGIYQVDKDLVEIAEIIKMCRRS